MAELVDAIVAVTAVVCTVSLAVLAAVTLAVLAPDHRHPIGRRWVSWYEAHTARPPAPPGRDG